MDLTYENRADELLLALTLGPTPNLSDYEVRESTVHGDKALAILTVDGQDFLVEVTPLPDGE